MVKVLMPPTKLIQSHKDNFSMSKPEDEEDTVNLSLTCLPEASFNDINTTYYTHDINLSNNKFVPIGKSFCLFVVILAMFTCKAEGIELCQTKHQLNERCINKLILLGSVTDLQVRTKWADINGTCCSDYKGTALHALQMDNLGESCIAAACVPEQTVPKGYKMRINQNDGNPILQIMTCSEDSYEEEDRQSTFIFTDYCKPKDTCRYDRVTMLCKGNPTQNNICICDAKYRPNPVTNAKCPKGFNYDDYCHCTVINCTPDQHLVCPHKWEPPPCEELVLETVPHCTCQNITSSNTTSTSTPNTDNNQTSPSPPTPSRSYTTSTSTPNTDNNQTSTSPPTPSRSYTTSTSTPNTDKNQTSPSPPTPSHSYISLIVFAVCIPVAVILFFLFYVFLLERKHYTEMVARSSNLYTENTLPENQAHSNGIKCLLNGSHCSH